MKKGEFNKTPGVANTGYFLTSGQHIANCSPAGGHIYVSCFFLFNFVLQQKQLLMVSRGAKGLKFKLSAICKLPELELEITSVNLSRFMLPSTSHTRMPAPSDSGRNKLLQTKQQRNCNSRVWKQILTKSQNSTSRYKLQFVLDQSHQGKLKINCTKNEYKAQVS